MRMSALEQLYQQVILDHAKERHGHGLRPAPSRTAAGSSHQYNPLCGDEVTVDVALAGDRVIAEGMQKVRPGAEVKAVTFDEGRKQPGNTAPPASTSK